MEITTLGTELGNWAGSKHLWVAQVFGVVLLSLMLNFFAKRFINRLHQRLLQTATTWDDALLKAARKPVSLAIWVIGLSYAAEITFLATAAPLFEIAQSARYIGIIAALTLFTFQFIQQIEENILSNRQQLDKEQRVDGSMVTAIAKLVRLSVIITAALVILQTLGFSISGILAFGGISGIAVGFAAKDLLANFFGALMIYLDRPFTVGDWIRSPDRELEGTVEYIGWRLTKIRTFDKRPLYIPNSVFANIVVENPSRMSNRRIYETIGIRYDDINKMNAITTEVKSMLSESPDIDTKQTLMVNFNAFAASSCDFFVYTFTKTTDWARYHQIKHKILLNIAAIIEEHHAEIAFPTSTLHIGNALPNAIIAAKEKSGMAKE